MPKWALQLWPLQCCDASEPDPHWLERNLSAGRDEENPEEFDHPQEEETPQIAPPVAAGEDEENPVVEVEVALFKGPTPTSLPRQAEQRMSRLLALRIVY